MTSVTFRHAWLCAAALLLSSAAQAAKTVSPAKIPTDPVAIEMLPPAPGAAAPAPIAAPKPEPTPRLEAPQIEAPRSTAQPAAATPAKVESLGSKPPKASDPKASHRPSSARKAAHRPVKKATRHAPPVAARPVAYVAPIVERFRIGAGGVAVIAGTAAPRAWVELLDGERRVASAEADARGGFVLLPDAPLSAGARRFAVAVDGQRGPQLILASIPSDPTARAMAVAVPRDGASGLTVLQAPAAPVLPPRVAIQAVEFTPQGTEIVGIGDPRSSIRLSVDGHPVAESPTDDLGGWRIRINPPADKLTAHLAVEQLGGGQALSRQEIDAPLALKTAAGAAPIWKLSRGTIAGPVHTLLLDPTQARAVDPDKAKPVAAN